MELQTSKVKVDYHNMRLALDQALVYLLGEKPFLGIMLQELSISYTNSVPTAGIFFNKKTRMFNMLINPEWFLNLKDKLERSAVLEHEVAHVIHKHVLIDLENSGFDKMRLNIAMDLVINQHINNLPKRCMLIENFTDKNGKPFPRNLSFEEYYELLDGATNNTPNQNGDGTGKDSDVHEWSDGDVSEEDLLNATADLLRRSFDRSTNKHHTVAGKNVKDCLEEISSRLISLNYKAILLNAIKKSLPAKFKKLTWKKPSRRYDFEAKGKLKAQVPRIEIFLDTSGSISTVEANEFLDIARGFLTNTGVAHVNLFHTENYFRKKMKSNFKLDGNEVQSGGTDLTDSFKQLLKVRCDLAIIITDGYFDMPNVDIKKLPKMVTILSHGGNKNHPLTKLGTTVEYKFSKDK